MNCEPPATIGSFLGRTWERYSLDVHLGKPARYCYKSGTLRIVHKVLLDGAVRVSFYCTRESYPHFHCTAKSASDARRAIRQTLARCGRLANA